MAALLTLGDLAFVRREAISFPLADEHGFAETPRLAGVPALQRSADAPRTGIIGLRLHEMFADVDVRVAAFREFARRKSAELLVYAPTGAHAGWFVIPRVEVTPILIGRPGDLIAADVAVSIREAPADRIRPAIVSDAMAARHGLTVTGSFEPIPIIRRTQHDLNDLRFLRELADEYGYRVKVDAGRLMFSSTAALDALPPVLTLNRSSLNPQSHIARATVNT